MAVEKNGEKGAGILQKLAENNNIRKIIIAAGLLGIALIFLSSCLTGGESGKTGEKTFSKPASGAYDYEERLENELTALLTKIQGVGNASVMVTLDRTVQNVYATEEKKNGQTTEEKTDGDSTRNEVDSSNETSYTIIRNSDGSEQALAVTEIQPEVKGVVVVCDGGDCPEVEQNIIDAVTTALHITSVRVCVIKAK